MEKRLHPGAPLGAKATQQGALPGVKATQQGAPPGVKATALPGVKATPLPGAKATPLPGVKATIPEALPGDQATGLQEQEEFRKIRVVTAPGAKYPRASNTIQPSQRPILLLARAEKTRQASTGLHHRLTARAMNQSVTTVPPPSYQKLLPP